MSFFQIFFIGVGLSMDAFAVSICKGLTMKKNVWKGGFIAGMYFGTFQMLMPLIGYFLGNQFHSLISNIDHWIAFILLFIIGGNMIRESFEEEKELNDSFDFRTMLLLSVATSIDALAVGITFSLFQISVLSATALIGLTTFCFSFAGIKIGNVFGNRFKNKAEILGGCILIFIGIKILLEHLIS